MQMRTCRKLSAIAHNGNGISGADIATLLLQQSSIMLVKGNQVAAVNNADDMAGFQVQFARMTRPSNTA
jgi:hypothetical protein